MEIISQENSKLWYLEQFNLLDSALDWSKVLYQLGTALASMKVIGIL